jgi:hypothetical protein
MPAVYGEVTSRPGFRGFTLGGVPDSRNGALIDAGAAIVLATHGRAFVAYDGQLSDTRTEHGLQAGDQDRLVGSRDQRSEIGDGLPILAG